MVAVARIVTVTEASPRAANEDGDLPDKLVAFVVERAYTGAAPGDTLRARSPNDGWSVAVTTDLGDRWRLHLSHYPGVRDYHFGHCGRSRRLLDPAEFAAQRVDVLEEERATLETSDAAAAAELAAEVALLEEVLGVGETRR